MCIRDRWERSYALLRAYREREGHARVPAPHVEEGVRLGGWLSEQRKRYQARGLSEEERKAKRLKVAPLSDEEVGRLEALGVMWNVVVEQWERNYALLRAYREREGHARVPASHVAEGEKLGSWLSTQAPWLSLIHISEPTRPY